MPRRPRSDALREAKESLIEGGLLSASTPGTVPELIERSWRRSLAQGAPAHRMTDRDIAEVNTESLLYRGALPVMRQLANDLADMEVAALISDARGRIIYRTVHSTAQRARLDSFGASPGFDFSEATVGTNGLGTVIEERRGLVISDAEHFNDALEREACAGAPIIDPRTRRVAGSLSLTTLARSASPIMTTLTVGTARQIEQHMSELVSGRRRALLDAYESASGAARGPIAVLSADTVLADPDGLAFLTPGDHARIWDTLMSHDAGWPARIPVELAGTPMPIDVRALEGPADHPAFEIVFIAEESRRRSGPSSRPPERVHPVGAVADELARVADEYGVVVLLGPSAIGKQRTARRMLSRRASVTVRAAGALDVRGWADVGARLARGEGVVLQHLEELSVDGAAALRRLAGSARRDQPTQLVLCADPDLPPRHVSAALAQAGPAVELPALSRIREAIPEYARALASDIVITASAMRALMRWDWPGNVAELERVLDEAVRRSSGSMVTEADLPRAIRENAAGSDLGGLARSEREAIIEALRASGGNRSAAATSLGIGRTTLYRKLRSLRIDT